MIKAHWYYMRDNHTFRSLPEDPKDIRIALMEELLSGYSHGALCTKTPGYEHLMVHASGAGKAMEFINECLTVMES